MRPILFRWRSLTIASYRAMLYIGLVAGIFAGNAAARATGVDPFRVFVATFLLLVPALAGARLTYVAAHWSLYRRDIRRIWDRRDGGAAQYGGLIVALPLSVPLVGALHVPLGAFWDAAAFTILVGMIFTRIGCLLNGCCAGRPSRAWGSLCLPNHLGVWERRIPTQCLEAAWAAVVLAAAVMLLPSRPFPGALFLFVALGYASGRVVLQSTRERRPGGHSFAVPYAVSLALIVSSLAVLTARWPK